MDPIVLARMQFALNISFHYIFPPLSVGLGLFLVITEGWFLRTKNPIYEKITKFWVKIFALIFAIGVATGLVMIFAFGNNWSTFSRYVGDVFGSVLGAEGIFAFFLESGFLGVLLFGWDKVSPKMHFFATIMVAFGAHFSALWIVIANSWMQTPAGHLIVESGGFTHAIIGDFWQVLLNPSSLDRIAHVILGCWLAGAFLVLSVSAYYLLRKRHIEFAQKSLKVALIIATGAVLLQLVSGDSTARGVAKNQPIKLAAFEGVYETKAPTPMYVGGVVDAKKREIKGFAIPGGLTLLVYRDYKTAVVGLDQFPEELWPNVSVVFQTYHGMITMWGFMFITVILALYAVWKKRLMKSKSILSLLVISVLFPQLANQLGWYSAEMGRQPWVVQGLLKTKDAVSPYVTSGQIIFSLVLFSLIYLLLFILFLYLLNNKIQHGPDDDDQLVEYRNPEGVL